MIRWLLILLVTLAIGATAAILLREDPGYVLIHVGGYSLETTLAAFVGLGVLALGLLAALARLIISGLRLPGRVAEYIRTRRQLAAQKRFRAGLLHLGAAQWQQAESELLRGAAEQEDPGANHLFAAVAAHELDAPERRDSYLDQARACGEQTEIAALMQSARMLAQDGRDDDALVALDRLAGRISRHAPSLELRLKLLERGQNWAALRAAIGEARGVVGEDRLRVLTVRAGCQALFEAGSSGRLESLRAAWNDIPKALRSESAILVEYARQLHQLSADAEAVRLVGRQLKKAWDAALVMVYGDLEGGQTVSQLASVEDWIKQYGERPELLLVAGRLCMRNRLWGRARSYFEAGLRLAPSPEFELELGRLALQSDDTAGALQHFRAGLESATGQEEAAQGAGSEPQVAKA